jgi:hypothetical protein
VQSLKQTSCHGEIEKEERATLKFMYEDCHLAVQQDEKNSEIKMHIN